MNDLREIVECLKHGTRFGLLTHAEPDADGVCSMLALGRTLEAERKEVLMAVGEPLSGPLAEVGGACRVVRRIESAGLDAVIALDCSDFSRMSPGVETGGCPLINIDHHRSNLCFGDLNLVDPGASSTAEMVWRLIKSMDLPVDKETAEHLFSGVQSDTGSFSFPNASSDCLGFASEMVRLGAVPWELWRRMNGCYGVERLRLLQASLETVEFHHGGRIGVITIVDEMFRRTGASPHDCRHLVDFPRNVKGVEISIMIVQAGERFFRFHLRSSGEADVACVSELFGGGGHRGAAGFDLEGTLEALKCRVIAASAESLERHFDGESGRSIVG